MRKIASKIFYFVARLFSKATLWLRPSDTRSILLLCNDPLMADYLGPFWELFQGDNRLKFNVLFCTKKLADDRMNYMKDRLPLHVVSERWAYARIWDLVVCADHCCRNICSRSQSVFICHGSKGKILSGDHSEYAYGKGAFDSKGRLLYKLMFEGRQADYNHAVQDNPALKDVIAVVGNLENDKVLAQMERRKEFRWQLGYKPDDIVVFILSTWGDHCLLHTMGDAILYEARKLQDRYKFILSAHPHEYRPKPSGQRVWGEYLRSQREYGFIVREPSDSWIPYMIACDIVVSDYTNLIQCAALLEKPILLTPVPEEVIWKDSVTWMIRQFAPVLNDARMLSDLLHKAQNDYPLDKLNELSQTIHPYPGQAADRIRKEVYQLLKLQNPLE